MEKTLSMSQLSRKRYHTMPFEGAWRDSFGEPEFSSKWLIYGGSGQGKTDFCVKLAKYISTFGRVLYVSAEEGDGKSINDAFQRNELAHSDVLLGVDYTYRYLLDKLRGSRKIKTVIIDSLDYFKITLDQYKELSQLGKTIICIAWANGKNPATKLSRDIEYMSDVKIRVVHYVAKVRSRHGGYADFFIWPEQAIKYHSNLALVN